MTKEALLESGTVKVLYLYSEATGASITELHMSLGNRNGDFLDYTSSLKFQEVRNKYTALLNEKINSEK